MRIARDDEALGLGMRVVGLAAVVLLVSGCAVRGRLHIFPRCADGLPPQILTDPACPPDSICGYSCLPDRWKLFRPGAQG